MSSRRQELTAQLSLALPILGGQLAQTANGFVDTMMAGRVSANDLAAVAVGASIWVPLFLFMTGVLMSATPILSRHLGGEAYHRINPLAQQGMWLGLGLGVLSALLLRSMAPVLTWMDVDPAICPKVIGYLNALSWGMPGAALMLAMRSYTEAMNHTRPVLWISVIGLLINIPANYVLIYGKLGLPALGGVGCGWATSLVMWSMALMMAIYTHRHPVYQHAPLNLRQRHFEMPSLGYMLRLGLPVGLSIFFEVSIFAVIALLIGSLGAQVVASHQIALNFTSLIFMVPLSFALAATVRVGHARGRGDRQSLGHAVQVAMGITVVVGLVASLGLVLARHWIPHIYTGNSQVVALASHLLLFAALYQVSDALQVCANGCLRGFEDTGWPMLMTLVAYWGIGLPLGYGLGMSHWWGEPMGPAGFWIGLVAGLTAAAVLLGLRLRWRLAQPLARHAANDDPATQSQAQGVANNAR
ncbi:MATE efflux family protein [Alcanivorax hongdengensis A-11-3]|uniref:Multidrug-efflux transporter n=1 Tax=Alcanivorax hongdengensis A-11-3 TaxID=1177179 RepID=L0WFT3_9GAMM|nr:MATE family efflux transporter [Alcanivorax hongdengensis]EKF75002.1 MATE efflux family protein [Alcanivorax hongdengensis A-11-3]